MPSSVDLRTWDRASPTDLSHRRPLIILVAIGVVVTALLVPQMRLPAKVPPLTIRNPTPYTLMIEASSPGDSGWAPVAIVHAGHSDTETQLIDEGAEWNLRFTGQGITLTGYHVSRADLASHSWTYTVPSDVAKRLEAQGAPPSP